MKYRWSDHKTYEFVKIKFMHEYFSAIFNLIWNNSFSKNAQKLVVLKYLWSIKKSFLSNEFKIQMEFLRNTECYLKSTLLLLSISTLFIFNFTAWQNYIFTSLWYIYNCMYNLFFIMIVFCIISLFIRKNINFNIFFERYISNVWNALRYLKQYEQTKWLHHYQSNLLNNLY